MARVFFHDTQGQMWRAPACGNEAVAVLRILQVASGCWTMPSRPVSSTPLLTHARALLAMQQRFDTVQTERVRQRPRFQDTPQQQHRSVGWPERPDEHSHDAAELRVVLAGRARYVLPLPGGGWLAVRCDAGDWLHLPAGLRHTFQASPTVGVDLLRLLPTRNAWMSERGFAPLPPALLAWSDCDDLAEATLAA